MATCSCRGVSVDCACGCYCICAESPNECWVGCEGCTSDGDLLVISVDVKKRPPGRPKPFDPDRRVTIQATEMSLVALALAIEKTANFRVGVPAGRAGERVTLKSTGTLKRVLPKFGLTLIPKAKVAKSPPARSA